MTLQRWTVGRCTITSILEEQIEHIPPEMFFPVATAADVARHGWLVPDFADADGRIALRVQALVVEIGRRCVLVDPCVGNGKTLAVPFWNQREWPFLERFADAGFAPERVDTVVHTHLHADHVGWDTHLADGRWVPTFTRARHLYTARELAWCEAGGNPGIDYVHEQSIAPVLEAGLGDVVAEDADLGDGLRLVPTPGHTPGHVSLWVDSDGATAMISGDFLHHPVQCAEPAWAEVGDDDADRARHTRRELLARAAASRTLFVGTHFPTRPAGRIVADGPAWRFVPEG
ncbi:MBL fold metallo-hydrolase [Candidatus Binatia bacterium]|nr:MBL fold metallo-hydrolase [Candidatus Binatia bacterium]